MQGWIYCVVRKITEKMRGRASLAQPIPPFAFSSSYGAEVEPEGFSELSWRVHTLHPNHDQHTINQLSIQEKCCLEGSPGRWTASTCHKQEQECRASRWLKANTWVILERTIEIRNESSNNKQTLRLLSRLHISLSHFLQLLQLLNVFLRANSHSLFFSKGSHISDTDRRLICRKVLLLMGLVAC